MLGTSFLSKCSEEETPPLSMKLQRYIERLAMTVTSQNYAEKGKTEIRPSAFRESSQDDQEMSIVFIGITSKKERGINDPSPSTL